MPFTQNTYWGYAAGEAVSILWELLWDQHGFIFGAIYLAWKLYQHWRGGGMGAAMTHVKDLWMGIKDAALPICQALLAAFLLLMFVWVPYQRAKEVEISHAQQIAKLGIEKDKAQIEKDRREAAIAKLCFNKPLRFSQRRVASSEKATYMLFSKQVEIWMEKGGMFRIYTDRQITGIAHPKGLVDLMTIERSYVEYRLISSSPPENPLTLTIFNGEPFEILCIDEVPDRFAK